MTPDRRKPGVAFWATVVVVVGLVLAAYPLSYGPAVWLNRHGLLDEEAGWIYGPLDELPEPFNSALDWYGSLWE